MKPAVKNAMYAGHPGAGLRVRRFALECLDPAGPHCVIDPSTGLIIGRDQSCASLVLPDAAISRRHASVEVREGGQLWLTDTSINGTFVNGSAIKQQQLQAGDEVQFGAASRWRYRVVVEGQPAERFAAAQAAAVAPVAAAVSPLPARMPGASLQFIVDQYRTVHFDLSGEFVAVGSRPGPGGIVIEHPGVGARHLELRLKEGRWYACNVDPSGTLLNRVPLRSLQPLATGDILQLGKGDCLLLFRGGAQQETLRDFALEQALVHIGRGPECDVHLDHPSISRLHAFLETDADGIRYIRDNDSTNGTFVNGARVRRQALRRGDQLVLGAVALQFDGERLETAGGVPRFRLTCEQLGKTVADRVTQQPLNLLQDVSLVVQPGELVGLLGPSGSGKSTLMTALNGSAHADRGRVWMNGLDLYRDFDALRSAIGSVPQDDILHRQLTVRRCLHYAARLRLPADTSDEEITKRVAEVMETLELTERAEVEISQLSGGQRKRVSLGVELLSKPAVLFLDEPTAGQDPRTEMKMMQLFRNIASRGSTVVLTTHLLGSFSLLDKVAVLVKGRLAYFGPGQELLPYFQQNQPGEIYDRLQQRQPEEWAQSYRESPLFQTHISRFLAGESSVAPATAPAAQPQVTRRRRVQNRLRMFTTLVQRQFELRLSRPITWLHLLWPLAAIAVLVALMKEAPNEPKTLFMTVLAALWFGGSLTVREVVDERAVFRRERQCGLGLAEYLGSKIVFAAVVSLAQSLVFQGMLTELGAQENHFWGATFFMWMLALQGGLIGLLISSLVKKPEQALQYFPLVLMPELLLAGLFLPVLPLHPIVPHWNRQAQRVQFLKVPSSLFPAPMDTALRDGLSPLMVSRWGLEGLADLYIHDQNPDYSLRILSTLRPSLHPDDPQRAKAVLRAIGTGKNVTMSSSAAPLYFAILALFSVPMIFSTAAILRLTEHRSGPGGE